MKNKAMSLPLNTIIIMIIILVVLILILMFYMQTGGNLFGILLQQANTTATGAQQISP